MAPTAHPHWPCRLARCSWATHPALQLDPLAGLTSLASLDLSGCGLGELPPEVAVLPMLRTLLLADNDLTALPGGLYLDSLESLDCGMNM